LAEFQRQSKHRETHLWDNIPLTDCPVNSFLICL
jgi:hypothetical protein